MTSVPLYTGLKKNHHTFLGLSMYTYNTRYNIYIIYSYMKLLLDSMQPFTGTPIDRVHIYKHIRFNSTSRYHRCDRVHVAISCDDASIQPPRCWCRCCCCCSSIPPFTILFPSTYSRVRTRTLHVCAANVCVALCTLAWWWCACACETSCVYPKQTTHHAVCMRAICKRLHTRI